MRIRHTVAIGAAVALTGIAVVPALASTAATSKKKISFQIVELEKNSTSHTTAVLHGAVNGAGRDVSNDKGNYDTLHLPGGTLRVTHPNKDGKFSYKPNPTTCFFSVTGTGKYTISKGTGSYKGVTGSGTYKLISSGFVAEKKGSCNFQGNRGTYVSSITGKGQVSLP